jgi:very-short-patch-repair endonuclease
LELEYDPRISKARGDYICAGTKSNPCSRSILRGDRYFCLTIIRGKSYRTVRYCLECAALLYPDMIAAGVQRIKSNRNLKETTKALNQQRYLSSQAKKFRKSSASAAEDFLWSLINGNQTGATFFRQKVLHGYIVDFWCPSKRLVVEVDGRHHLARKKKDANRDEILKAHGIRVIRFPASIVFQDPKAIIDQIKSFLLI